ncbi:MAG: 16S rRNA (cytosine(967)-C(5))-methyltransferase RsmB [Desulfobacterales bacterium]|nr:16S rRNA (cytosine(967)-C(5))-methyltransferase RsmB [Desulfobacterales bacterium]
MSSARQIAFDLLRHTNDGRYPLDHWLDQSEPRLRALSRADRALVHALVYGTLRWQGRLDFIIDHLADKPGKIDLRARIILRIALFQMHHMDRIPEAAAVHSAVELAKKNRLQWAAGFINGLLRRAARRPLIPFPDFTKVPDQALAVTLSFPHWLTTRWLSRWGPDETWRLCEAINRVPSLTLRANTLKIDRPALMEALQVEAAQVQSTPHAPAGVTITALNRPISQWPSFQQGWFQVQDEAAQLVVHMLAPQPGETVWDACAGLGTKTAHIAQRMNNQGHLLASDLNPFKLDRLTEEMGRLGVTIVTCRALDLTAEGPSDWPAFDRILVDAPCSGLGVLQKNPDGKWRITAQDLARYQHRQVALLARAAPHLRAGGLLVYAVCSFEPEENEAVMKAFLQNHPDFAIHHPGTRAAVDFQPALLTPEGCLSTLPHRHLMDGFFAAAFTKRN